MKRFMILSCVSAGVGHALAAILVDRGLPSDTAYSQRGYGRSIVTWQTSTMTVDSLHDFTAFRGEAYLDYSLTVYGTVLPL